MSDGAAFLEALFPPEVEYPAEAVIVLFSLPGKITRTFALDDREGLLAEAAALTARGENVYAHVALHDVARFAPGGRGRNDTAVVLSALFDEIDALVPGHRHKGEALPGTIEEAREFFNALPSRPSLIVDSGFGLQAYWIFREPLFLNEPDDRAAAETLLARYRQHRDSVATSRGWKLDAVGDLARIGRFPGTRNLKNPDVIREVTLLESSARRYNLTELLDALPPLKIDPPVTSTGPILTDTARTAQARALVRAARGQALGIGRNPGGFWLACQLRDAGLTAEDALEVGADYVAFVDRSWPDRNYGLRQEYAESVRQAFGRPARAPLPTLANLVSVEHVHDGREKTLRKLARELYFRHVEDDLTASLVAMLNATRCRPPLAAVDLARILDEAQARIEGWRARRAS